jgi:hypothetical protein
MKRKEGKKRKGKEKNEGGNERKGRECGNTGQDSQLKMIRLAMINQKEITYLT